MLVWLSLGIVGLELLLHNMSSINNISQPKIHGPFVCFFSEKATTEGKQLCGEVQQTAGRENWDEKSGINQITSDLQIDRLEVAKEQNKPNKDFVVSS